MYIEAYNRAPWFGYCAEDFRVVSIMKQMSLSLRLYEDFSEK